MHPVLLASLLLCALLTGCNRRVVTSSSASAPATPNTLVAGTFITSGGNWTHRQGSDGRDLRVELHPGGNLHWNYTQSTYMPHGGRSSGGSGSHMGIADKGTAPWFIYVEAPDRLWFFDGKAELSVQQASGYNMEGARVISGGKLQDEAELVPAELIPRLPADLQGLLPKPAAPAKRPSI